jgi:hypothetical protein
VTVLLFRDDDDDDAHPWSRMPTFAMVYVAVPCALLGLLTNRQVYVLLLLLLFSCCCCCCCCWSKSLVVVAWAHDSPKAGTSRELELASCILVVI